mmetsp:Transcript_46401/g.111642  ORF Transcript_46401/g.111642 Transcript_46401/m.111642 type:complete len:82 (-) Transcript_46401:47-292(-)
MQSSYCVVNSTWSLSTHVNKNPHVFLVRVDVAECFEFARASMVVSSVHSRWAWVMLHVRKFERNGASMKSFRVILVTLERL